MDGASVVEPDANSHAKSPSTPPGYTDVGTFYKKRAALRVLKEEERQFRPDVYWYLSFRCNLACEHCSVKSSPWVDTSKDLTTDECMRVVDQMAELNVANALLTGGEVLIRPDALEIMRALDERGVGIGLETNGLRFDKAFVELAGDLQARKRLGMTISLDGGTKETHERLRGPHSFDRTVRGLRFLRDNGVRFSIQCVLNSSNIHTITNLYALAEELRPACESVHWAFLNPIGRGSELVTELGLGPQHLDGIFQRMSVEKPKFAGSTVVKLPPAAIPPRYITSVIKGVRTTCITSCHFPLLGVLPNGDVTICGVSRDDETLHFGNIRDTGTRLKDIWLKTRMDMLRSSYVAAEDLEGICGDCVWKFACKGACRAWAYEEGGSFNAPFPICAALDEAGGFPKAYRLSHQSAMTLKKFQEKQAVQETGCGCSA